MEQSGYLRALSALLPDEIVPDTHWIGRYMDPGVEHLENCPFW
jgi:hypothetical protein